MWTSTRRTRAAHPTRSRQVGVAVALMACVGLAACTATEPPSPASTAEADTIAPFPESGVIDAGTYLVTGYPVPFEITVPDGWETFDGAGLCKDDPDLPDSCNGTVLFWPATYVPTDACAWRGALVQIDPTAEAFVDAMTAQASTVSTPAVEVMVGDYSGFEFDYAVESDVDFTDCDVGKFCVYSESAQDCNARVYAREGERETYLVVDLNGERAVIAVGQSDESMDPALTKEARAIFDSIRFGPAPDYVLALESVGAHDGEPKDPHDTLKLLGLRSGELRQYEDFRTVSVWSGESRTGETCLLVFRPDQGLREGLSADVCSPLGVDPIADLVQMYSGPGGSFSNDPVFANMPTGSLIRLELKGDHVDVYVYEKGAGPSGSQG